VLLILLRRNAWNVYLVGCPLSRRPLSTSSGKLCSWGSQVQPGCTRPRWVALLHGLSPDCVSWEKKCAYFFVVRQHNGCCAKQFTYIHVHDTIFSNWKSSILLSYDIFRVIRQTTGSMVANEKLSPNYEIILDYFGLESMNVHVL
jgi:hypothetical protein